MFHCVLYCFCRAPANLSRLQAAAAGAQWPGSDVTPLHGSSGEPACHQAAAPADTSDPLQLLWSVTDFTVDEVICQTCQSNRWPPSLVKVGGSQELQSAHYNITIRKIIKDSGFKCPCFNVSRSVGVFFLSSMIFVCLTTDLNCTLILNARGAEMICLHMNEPDPSGRILFCSSEILWNLLERISKEEVTAQLSSMECVLYVSLSCGFKRFSYEADDSFESYLSLNHHWSATFVDIYFRSLKEAFFHQLINSLRDSDLRLTNDLLVITTLIAANPNNLLIVSTKLLIFWWKNIAADILSCITAHYNKRACKT